MRYSLVFILCVQLLISCKKDGSIKEIYTCGMNIDTSGSGNIEGVYHKNLMLKTLIAPVSPVINFSADDIFLENDDVYVLGTMSPLTSDRKKTIYWKNDVITYLDRGAPNSEASDLFVENSHVYVLVNDNLNAMINMGYYKDGEYVTVSSTQGNGVYGIEMFVRNGKNYIAGYEFYNGLDNTLPKYWINDSNIDLSAPEIWSGVARSVYVTESNISYVAGSVIMDESYLISIPVFWRNGIYAALPLSSGNIGGVANSVYVDGGNVYIGGMQFDAALNCNITYWLNGTPVVIDRGVLGYSSVKKIVASDGNVYCIGFRDASNSAALWINGSRVNLSKAGGFSYLSGLFVR